MKLATRTLPTVAHVALAAVCVALVLGAVLPVQHPLTQSLAQEAQSLLWVLFGAGLVALFTAHPRVMEFAFAGAFFVAFSLRAPVPDDGAPQEMQGDASGAPAEVIGLASTADVELEGTRSSTGTHPSSSIVLDRGRGLVAGAPYVPPYPGLTLAGASPPQSGLSPVDQHPVDAILPPLLASGVERQVNLPATQSAFAPGLLWSVRTVRPL